MIRSDSDTPSTAPQTLADRTLRSTSRPTETAIAVRVDFDCRKTTRSGVTAVTYRSKRTGNVDTETIL